MKKLFLLLLVAIAFSSCAITEPVPMNYYPYYPVYGVYYGVPYSYGYYHRYSYSYGGYHHHR